jgi:heme A synthase
MAELEFQHGFPCRRLLRLAAVGMLALLFVLLALGAIVTSFRVGMADPVWPTRPWHLLTISYEEPSAGYLIEHTHRAAGFTVGIVASLFAMLCWLTERRPILRWSGLVAIVAFVGLFAGHLHGTLIAQRNAFVNTGELTQPNWLMVLGPTLAALAVTLVLALASATAPGSGLRLLSLVLLTAVMTQGVLGGLRVYLNALWGTDLAIVHGVFSQIVMAIAVTMVILAGAPRNPAVAIDRHLMRLAVMTLILVFGQIIAGAVLRQTSSSVGPRLHLLGAFLVVFAVAGLSRRSRGTQVRRLAVLASSLAGLQILLGIEAWMMRFRAGLELSALQRITTGDAIVRTLHALTGYALFAAVVATVAVLIRDREKPVREQVETEHLEHAEAVA